MRIYRIPLLPLKAIFDHMEKVELLSFSFCSKRAHQVLEVCKKKDISYFNLTEDEINRTSALNILELFLLEVERTDKKVLKKKEIELKICLDHWLSIEVNMGNSVNLYISSLKAIDNHTGPRRSMLFNEHRTLVLATLFSFYTFWDDKGQGLLFLVDYFNENFKCIIDLDIASEVKIDRRLEWIFQKLSRDVVQSGVMFRDASLDDDYKYPIKNLRVKGAFEIHAKPSEKLKFKRCGSWFTLQHLCNGNLRNAHMESMNITNKAFKEFLQSWMEGKCPKLERLKFGMNTNIDQWSLPMGWEKLWKSFKYKGFVAGRDVTARIEWNSYSKHVTLTVKHEDFAIRSWL